MKQYIDFFNGKTATPPQVVVDSKEIDFGGYKAGEVRVPPRLSVVEQSLSRKLRGVTRELEEVKRERVGERQEKAPGGVGRCQDAGEIIGKIRGLLEKRGKQRTVASERKEEQCATTFTAVERDVERAVKGMERTREVVMNNDEVLKELDTVRQDNLNLRTQVEMVTFDLAEFDELSLETQILREAQFRTEKRVADDQKVIEELRRKNAILERDCVKMEENHANDVTELTASLNKGREEEGDKKGEITALTEQLEEVAEQLGVNR